MGGMRTTRIEDEEEEDDEDDDEEEDEEDEDKAHGQPVRHACAATGAAEPEVLMVWPEAKTRKKEKQTQQARQDFETCNVCMSVMCYFQDTLVRRRRARNYQARTVGGPAESSCKSGTGGETPSGWPEQEMTNKAYSYHGSNNHD
jgi:hypothetical protein